MLGANGSERKACGANDSTVRRAYGIEMSTRSSKDTNLWISADYLGLGNFAFNSHGSSLFILNCHTFCKHNYEIDRFDQKPQN